MDTVCILAPGLLGASLAMALKSHSLAKSIHVWARRVETRLEIARLPWCDAVFDSAETAVQGADLVVICSPVETIVPLTEKIAPHLKAGAIVTDVGSTKGTICRHAHATLSASKAAFVGSHPMAGSEKSGHEFASADLFRGRSCFVTPIEETPLPAVKSVVALWQNLDMRVNTISPEKHDEIVANISHLPHVLASVLSAQLLHKDKSWGTLAGNGLADTTRIAAGNPVLWRHIFEQNRDEVLRAITDFENELHSFKSALNNQNYIELLHILEAGKKFRDAL